jgi:hypothetical protein
MDRNKLSEGKIIFIIAGLVAGFILFFSGLVTYLKNISLNPNAGFEFGPIFALFIVAAFITLLYYPLGFISALGLKALRFFAYQGTKEVWDETEFFSRAALWPVVLLPCSIWYLAVLIVNSLAQGYEGINEETVNARQWFYKESKNEPETVKNEARING